MWGRRARRLRCTGFVALCCVDSALPIGLILIADATLWLSMNTPRLVLVGWPVRMPVDSCCR